jgi:hypothetical protein
MWDLLKSPFALLVDLFVAWPWWIRGIMGATWGAAIFIGFPAALNWTKDKHNVAKLRIDCLDDFVPMLMPDAGRVHVVQLRSIFLIGER